MVDKYTKYQLVFSNYNFEVEAGTLPEKTRVAHVTGIMMITVQCKKWLFKQEEKQVKALTDFKRYYQTFYKIFRKFREP